MKIQEINEDSHIGPKLRTTKKKKVRKRFFGLKFLVFVVLLAAALILIALTPIFNIRHIEVQGSKRYDQADILRATDISIGSNGFKTIGGSLGNIFSLRYKKAEDSILKSYPYIKDVTVKFVLPGTIKISIAERKEMGIISYMSSILLIDREGYVLDEASDSVGLNLPAIKGIKLQSYKVGQAFKADDTEKLAAAVRILDSVENSDKTDKPALKPLIKSVDVSDLKKVRILVDSRITANFGDIGQLDDEELNYRLTFFRQIYSKNINDYDKGTVDLSTGKDPSFLPDD